MPPKARPKKGLSAAAKAEIESRQKLREEKDAHAQAERERLAREEAHALEELRLEKARLELRAQKRAATIAMAKANGTYKSKRDKRKDAQRRAIRQAFEDQIGVSSRAANLTLASTSSDAEVLDSDAVGRPSPAEDRRDAERTEHHWQATSNEPGAGAVDDDDKDNWETLADESPKNRETDQADVNDEVKATNWETLVDESPEMRETDQADVNDGVLNQRRRRRRGPRPSPAKVRRDAERAEHHRQVTSMVERLHLLENDTEPEARAAAALPQAVQAVEDDDKVNWETLADESPKSREIDQADVNDKVEASADDDDNNNNLDFLGYRSPIVCIMGHVNTGKTKLLDKIRRTNVQDSEPGGITQQIGVTFFPDIALEVQTTKIDEDFEIEVPGMMIIDTPGHQHFSNLRSRGSSLCDIAVLVVDIMHGLEPTTVESLELLQKRRCPFIIALNKVDRLYSWREENYTDIQSAIDRQADHVKAEFRNRFDKIQLQLAERGLNCYLYWENEDFAKYVSVIPTSAITGEGIPDLLYMILNVCQNVLPKKLEIQEELECTVMEVKDIEGLGTTIDVVLKNGSLRQGDQIVIAGVAGPIVTTIRELVTPQPMKEMRVKGEYTHYAEISTSLGVKICAPELENAVAGSELFVVGPEDDVEELKAKIEDSFCGDLMDFEKAAEGVYVQASTIGALEALLSYLTDMKIPVFGWGIGEVQLMDVKKASLMKEKKHSEYAVILAFDVKVNKDAQILAAHRDIPIFTADIIYHLSDQFTKHIEHIRKAKNDAVFPVIMKIDPRKIFHNKDPLICGVNIVEGQLRIGTPLCMRNEERREVGRVIGIEKDNKPLQVARKGQEVSVAIEQSERFDHTRKLYSKITRSSIDSLKALHMDEMRKQDWDLVIFLKDIQKIQ